MKDNVNIWCKPITDPAAVIESIKHEIENPPEEVTVAFTLHGKPAKRYYFISLLLETALGYTPEEIANYLATIGVEHEISKLSVAMAKLNFMEEENNE